MNNSPSFDMKAALQHPASAFSNPLDVVNHPALTVEVKFKVLEQWERDARASAAADQVRVTGGEENLLSRIRRATRELDIRADPRAHASLAGPKTGP
jgi:hypothetical protein